MSKYLFILFILMILSCNQSQSEKDYIKNLEDKNEALEKEIQEIKSKSESANNQGSENKPKISNDYFTIGSIEDEVIEVMGEPTSYMVTAPEARKFLYGISTVYFYQGKVISYDNLGDNLKVRVRK